MAAKTFWISYSAYSRAATPQVVDNLLKTLSDEFRATWHETGEYKLVWHEMYADMVKYYVDRVKFYGDKYMTSPAGMSLKTAIAKHRKRHISVPVCHESQGFVVLGRGTAIYSAGVVDLLYLARSPLIHPIIIRSL